MTRALLTDLGETLFKEQPMDRRAAAMALAAEPRFAPFLPDVPALEAGQAADDVTWTVLQWLSAMLPPDLAEEAEILVFDHGVKMTPMPGAREALATLSAAGYQVGVVSNTRFSGRAWQHALRRQGLAADFVVSSADVKARKPDPAIFRAALDRLRLPAEEVWYVGDSWEKDVSGAAAAGMRPIWFHAPPGPLSSCAWAPDWAAVLRILEV